MLKILDKNKRVKYVWQDDNEEPVSIDELILREVSKPDKSNQVDQKKENEEKK